MKSTIFIFQVIQFTIQFSYLSYLCYYHYHHFHRLVVIIVIIIIIIILFGYPIELFILP